MVTPRPSFLRTLAIIISTILCALFAASCSRSQSSPVITHAEISTVFHQRDGVAGQWDHNNRTIYLSAMTARWTWAHELCHAADSMGITYQQALMMAGKLPPHLSHHQDLARQVSIASARIGGPFAHWIALARICGPAAVGHDDIMKHIRHRI